MTRASLAVILTMPLLLVGGSSALADECGIGVCSATHGGVVVEVVVKEPAHSSAVEGHGRTVRRRMESVVTPGCPLNDPNAGVAYDVACSYMSTACASRGLHGWLVWVWSRRAGSSERWVRSGFACRSPREVQAGAPGVTRGLVQRAFRQLHFAHPQAHVQPEGDLTLVQLPTYYEVAWPVEGFEPGEVATVRLLGRTVRLRPRVVSYTYRFGDGARLGPTSDAGGPYPTGYVQHTYVRTGEVQVSIVATYTGDYQLGGGAWEPIDLTIPVTGDPVTVEVRQARARLEASPPQR